GATGSRGCAGASRCCAWWRNGRCSGGRGRDSGCPLPPAQTRARATNAHGSHLGDEHAQPTSACTRSLGIVLHRCSLAQCPASAHAAGISLADRLPSTCPADSLLPLFADLVGTMRSLDSPPPFMRDLPLIAFSLRPATS